MDVQDIVDELNARREHVLSIESRSEYGISGSWTLVDSVGQHYVLKSEQGSASQRLLEVVRRVDRLRAKGYLAPRHYSPIEVSGTTAWLQDFETGVANDEITRPLLASVTSMIRLQYGEGDQTDTTWPDHMEQSLLEGVSEYCGHSRLQDFSDGSRALLHRIKEVGRSSSRVLPAGKDIAHHDLHHRNVLRNGGALSAIIDWDTSRQGDALFDLVAFVFWLDLGTTNATREDHEWATNELVEARRDDVVGVYVAHLSIRAVNHALRTYGPDRADVWIARCNQWLDRWAPSM